MTPINRIIDCHICTSIICVVKISSCPPRDRKVVVANALCDSFERFIWMLRSHFALYSGLLYGRFHWRIDDCFFGKHYTCTGTCWSLLKHFKRSGFPATDSGLARHYFIVIAQGSKAHVLVPSKEVYSLFGPNTTLEISLLGVTNSKIRLSMERQNANYQSKHAITLILWLWLVWCSDFKHPFCAINSFYCYFFVNLCTCICAVFSWLWITISLSWVMLSQPIVRGRGSWTNCLCTFLQISSGLPYLFVYTLRVWYS